MSFTIAPEALADLDAIWLFIAADNLRAADRVLDGLHALFESLSDHPRSGRKRDELAPGLRSYPRGNYVVFYRIERENVDIVRVLHGAMDIESEFDQ